MTLDPKIAIPVTWPKGTYSLPMPNTGCPNAHFEWSTGLRRQITDSQKPSNTWDNVTCNHLKGYMAKDQVVLHFCSKIREEEDRYGWTFQPGKYCIMKKGNSCPAGNNYQKRLHGVNVWGRGMSLHPTSNH